MTAKDVLRRGVLEVGLSLVAAGAMVGGLYLLMTKNPLLSSLGVILMILGAVLEFGVLEGEE